MPAAIFPLTRVLVARQYERIRLKSQLWSQPSPRFFAYLPMKRASLAGWLARSRSFSFKLLRIVNGQRRKEREEEGERREGAIARRTDWKPAGRPPPLCPLAVNAMQVGSGAVLRRVSHSTKIHILHVIRIFE